jgi:CubicO group peptidase (beta-lactamase class C family)
MRAISRFGLAGALMLRAAALQGAPAADPPSGDVGARVDALFTAYTADTPGCAVGVSKDGKEVLTRAYGSADLEHGVPNTADTVFEAGSVSKQFTAAAVLLLAQAGKLKLDDPVRDYVPELPDYGTPEITLRHLLHHTSGLRDWGTVTYAAGWPRGSRMHTHAHVLDVVSRQKSLNFPPGSEYSYSNTGYNLLAIIVERVSGKTFAQYTRDTIFEPLGMTHTQWRDDRGIVKGSPWSRRGAGFPHADAASKHFAAASDHGATWMEPQPRPRAAAPLAGCSGGGGAAEAEISYAAVCLRDAHHPRGVSHPPGHRRS